jgi:hypothetical protein
LKILLLGGGLSPHFSSYITVTLKIVDYQWLNFSKCPHSHITITLNIVDYQWFNFSKGLHNHITITLNLAPKR